MLCVLRNESQRNFGAFERRVTNCSERQHFGLGHFILNEENNETGK